MMTQQPPAPSVTGTHATETGAVAPLNFVHVLQTMLSVSSKVSDLIFSPGRPPQVELLGKLQGVAYPGLEKLLPAHTSGISKIIMGKNPAAVESLEKFGSADVSFSAPGLSRFRVNIFMQRGTHAIVMRVIPTEPPKWSDFNLPPQLKEIAELKTGLVLVTGPTGSGKSSTLAAIIDLINETKYYHIVTIEDPIEFLHRHKNSTIHQREIHSDTPDFARALRAALRQAPKVILVGEMRDRETIEVALEAAETGHLVFSTLHTIDASKTVDRIIGVFPKIEEAAIRARLSQTFRFIISQRLVPRADGKGRVAASRYSNPRAHARIHGARRDRKAARSSTRWSRANSKACKPSTTCLRSDPQRHSEQRRGLSYASNQGNLRLKLATSTDAREQKTSRPQNGGGSMLDMLD
jgi:twitching motility protein PilT